MASGFILFSVFLSVCLFILFIYLLYLSKPKKLQPTNYDVFENDSSSHITNGYSEFNIFEYIFGKKRMGLKLIPININPLPYYNKRKRRYVFPKELFEPKLYWFKKEKLEFLPRGTRDKEKNYVRLIPDSVKDINPALKDTPSGKTAMILTSVQNKNLQVENFLADELTNAESLINNKFIGNITPKQLKRIELTSQEINETIAKKDDKKPASFGFNYGQTGEHRI